MPLDDAALQIMGNALDAAITHIRFHSADPGSGELNALGAARQAIAFTSDADGDLTLNAPVTITGLAADQPVAYVTLWTALSGGSRLAKSQLTGDTAANSAGEYSLVTLPITGASS